MMQKQIAVIVSGFPRRSETFALNELSALEARGSLAAIFATKAGDGANLQPGYERLLPLVKYLPQGTALDQGVFAAASLRKQNVVALHGYFAHTPAEVAMHAGEKLRVPFGFSVHARDARKLSTSELTRRAQKAACVVACNTDVATTMQMAQANAYLIPHGVNLTRFRAVRASAHEPFRIVAVGRLVEKKGFDYLIAAASQLKFSFTLKIIGDGPEQQRLEDLIFRYGLDRKVTLLGAQSHDEIPHQYAKAHAVVVPSVSDRSGDRDGLPNVVLEAMACARPIVATKAGAIESAVVEGKTGLLVAQKDATAIAQALTLLKDSPSLQHELGRNARCHVERHYELTHCTGRFCELLEQAYA